MVVGDSQWAGRKGVASAFLLALLLFFLCMSPRANEYDEGLVLTAAMRVGAGEVPHRDFYSLYGPAQYYVLAGLFKMFGQSLLVARLYDLVLKATLFAAFFSLVRRYCNPLLAGTATVFAGLTILGFLNETGSPPVLPISLLMLTATAMLLPIWQSRISFGRAVGAGALAGLVFLFRYDVGIANFGVHLLFILLATFPGSLSGGSRLQRVAEALLPYLLGFIAVSLPVAILYLRVAPLHDLVFDVYTFQAQNYHKYRNLPWPRIRRGSLELLSVYVPFLVATPTLLICAGVYLRSRRDHDQADAREEGRSWFGFLFCFSLLAAVMCLKGSVRTSVTHMYLAMIPALLLLAILLEHRRDLARPLRWAVWACTVAAVVGISFSAKREVGRLRALSLKNKFLLHRTQLSTSTELWCNERNSLTRGLCFYTDEDREHAIEFLDHSTNPGERIFVGNGRHDKIFDNDNLTYFATGRLPAVKWSEYDAGLQIQLPIQQEMVQEIERARPRYAVISSAFDDSSEPNASSQSSGVIVLGEYLHSKYEPVTTFGKIQILQRKD